VAVCYGPPDQEDRADEASIDRLEQPHGHRPCSSWGTSATLISVGGTTWQGNFPFQAIEEPTGRGAMVDLVLTNKEGLMGNGKFKGSLGCSDREMVEFRILRAARRAHSKLTALDFRRG